MWDSTTLATEKQRRPDMAQVILGDPPKPENPDQYRERIKKLNVDRKEDDAMWWNDQAVAYMRLGELTNAMEFLKTAVTRFPNDYGVHANLGTAYHLMGRYADAEKEIARDLEINPDAHFGLEKYHLALLQFLTRDARYQSRHLYVDELTGDFLRSGPFIRYTGGYVPAQSTNTGVAQLAESTNTQHLANSERKFLAMRNTSTNQSELDRLLVELNEDDPPPQYTAKWNLAEDPKLKKGVLYMASLNPKEPACFEMLGVVCLLNSDRHLAVAAFEKAVMLGSPQKYLLEPRIKLLKDFIDESTRQHRSLIAFLVFVVVLVCLLGAAVVMVIKKLFTPRRT